MNLVSQGLSCINFCPIVLRAKLERNAGVAAEKREKKLETDEKEKKRKTKKRENIQKKREW